MGSCSSPMQAEDRVETAIQVKTFGTMTYCHDVSPKQHPNTHLQILILQKQENIETYENTLIRIFFLRLFSTKIAVPILTRPCQY